MAELAECIAETDTKHWAALIEAEERERPVAMGDDKENMMEDIEALKAQIKKLNAQATNLKMNLHDLAEDLPTGWEKIPEVAEQAFQAYKNLTEARTRLAAAGG